MCAALKPLLLHPDTHVHDGQFCRFFAKHNQCCNLTSAIHTVVQHSLSPPTLAHSITPTTRTSGPTQHSHYSAPPTSITRLIHPPQRSTAGTPTAHHHITLCVQPHRSRTQQWAACCRSTSHAAAAEPPCHVVQGTASAPGSRQGWHLPCLWRHTWHHIHVTGWVVGSM